MTEAPTKTPFHVKKFGVTCAHQSYGLTCEQYNALVAEYEERCPICGRGSAEVPLVIDHDPAVGRWAVRGILCAYCNSCLDLPLTFGPARDAYLADPWHARHPEHPVVPTPRQPTPLAQSLYRELEELTCELRPIPRRTRPRHAAWVRAGEIGVALLREGEKPSSVLAKAPFSDSHLRTLARLNGLPPAQLCGRASPSWGRQGDPT